MPPKGKGEKGDKGKGKGDLAPPPPQPPGELADLLPRRGGDRQRRRLKTFVRQLEHGEIAFDNLYATDSTVGHAFTWDGDRPPGFPNAWVLETPGHPAHPGAICTVADEYGNPVTHVTGEYTRYPPIKHVNRTVKSASPAKIAVASSN